MKKKKVLLRKRFVIFILSDACTMCEYTVKLKLEGEKRLRQAQFLKGCPSCSVLYL